MKVLLSIKPKFAEKIFSGEKKYEFRRTIFKNKDIKKIVVYVSAPVQKVIGEFEIDQIISNEPAELWKQTKESSGISEEFFFQYFTARSIAYAIKVKSVKKYKKPLCIRKDFKVTPPQSFIYIS